MPPKAGRNLYAERMADELLEGAAYHEAGHVVLGLIFGHPFHFVEVYPNGTGFVSFYGRAFRGESLMVGVAGLVAELLLGELVIHGEWLLPDERADHWGLANALSAQPGGDRVAGPPLVSN